jgi:hypothetical protein
MTIDQVPDIAMSRRTPRAPGSSSSSAPIVRDSQSLLDNMNRVLCSYRA